MNNIANWLRTNKLTLNIDKSSLIKFGRHRDCNNEKKLTIQIGDEKLQQKDFAKCLGVYFDNNFRWKKHIEMTNIKVNKGVGILRKMCHFLQEKQLKNLYNAFIKLFTEYDGEGVPKRHLIKIERSLNKAVGIMLL